jgi:hypothetical protein
MEPSFVPISDYPVSIGIVCGMCLLISIIALALCVYNRARLRSIQTAYKNLTKLVSGKDLDALIAEELEVNKGNAKILDEHSNRITGIENKLRKAVDHIGFVRFNSFESMTAELSYALAMVNQEGDGILITSIYTVEECRTYGKRIEGGKCVNKASEEENRAIKEACQGLKIL